jgi:hypothetical protein
VALDHGAHRAVDHHDPPSELFSQDPRPVRPGAERRIRYCHLLSPTKKPRRVDDAMGRLAF